MIIKSKTIVFYSLSSNLFSISLILGRVFSKNSGISDKILYSLTPMSLLISLSASSAVTFFLSLQSNIPNVGLSFSSLMYLSTALK